jgi:parvulin-like peptidyl-prolyl isomerase
VDSQELVEQILAQLEEGADFVELAREHSLDVATRENGGDLGWFPRGLVAPELESAVFILQPGEISDGVAVNEGFHIIQMLERDPAHPLTDEIKMHVREARFSAWLAEQRATATIDRFVGQ